MKYVIIGAGGTGGILGFYMKKAGKDVTFIARNKHLEAIKKNGLSVEKMWENTTETIPIAAESMESFAGEADVIFVCVKKYSLDACIPWIQKIAGKETIVIPILNVYGTGGYLQERLPGILVTDGCIYVSANIKEPGALLQHGEILRVFFGVRRPEELGEGEKYLPVLKKIEEDLKESHIDGILTDQIQRDAMVKFSYVSPIGTAGLFLNVTAGDFQKEGEARELFQTMVQEIVMLSHAMGLEFEEDLVKRNLKIVEGLAPETTTSMQRDVMEGKKSEIDGLVYEVVRLAEHYHIRVPAYEKAAETFRKKGIE